ncbi:bifunctional helix-turn-helix transcriptional regulator/GNAT family N-acetyltransferase [Pararhodobacter sp.]|uniref:bifunctional helix-turn-helix transcriptional regulator/GNAT family N-acetyltransferase n=1 Tax=Pararhodobacter sp. TaxID=2127056 RepID=UPI002FDCF28F
MPLTPAPDTIDAIRTASRELVRQLGFMGGKFAGTDLPPSAVHALVEIESGGVTARDLTERLHLEKSSISRMLRKLVESGEVIEQPGEDGRVKVLGLSEVGRQRVHAIHAFAAAQVSDALDRLTPGQAQRVREGLSLYAGALGAEALPPTAQIRVITGYQTGLIARITQMHALYYARSAGFGQEFEAGVAGGLAEFCTRLHRPVNAIWTAVQGQEIVGSIAIDGEDLGENVAHLRWFILDDHVRGTGAGRRLLSAALDFVDQKGFAEVHLWTFSGLNAARHLYEGHGFELAEERPGMQWGKEILEQRFVRRRA